MSMFSANEFRKHVASITKILHSLLAVNKVFSKENVLKYNECNFVEGQRLSIFYSLLRMQKKHIIFIWSKRCLFKTNIFLHRLLRLHDETDVKVVLDKLEHYSEHLF